MSATSSATSEIPVEMSRFFQTLYMSEPEVSSDRKNTTYAVPGKGVSIQTDRYGSCHIEVKEISTDIIQIAKQAIENLSQTYKGSIAYNSIWINIALPADASIIGSIAPSSFKIGAPGVGDIIYDYQKSQVRIWHWLNPNKACAIPPGATHNIGATALLVDRFSQTILLVEHRRRGGSWILPGGSFDPSKDKEASDTARREAQEEVGIDLKGSSDQKPKLVGQMEFPNNQFAPAINQIWAFFVDGMSQNPLNLSSEISKAEWVPIKQIQESTENYQGSKLSKEVKAPLLAAISGLGFQEESKSSSMILYAPKPL